MLHSEPSTHVALLHQISNIVSSHLTLDRILQELIGLAVEVTGCDACLVYLVDQPTGEMVLRASQLPHTAEIGSIRMHMGEGITGWVAEHKSVVALSSRAAADSRFKLISTLPEDSYEAFLSVPLVSGGQLVGVINIHHRQPHSHTPEEIALVAFIGEQLGGAMAKSRLAERSENASRRLEALVAIARSISEESDLDRLLPEVATLLAGICEAAACSVVLEGCEYRYPESERGPGLFTTISVPLMTRETPLGAIHIHSHEMRPAAEEEVSFVRVVAGQLATAIENSRLLSETLEMKRALEVRKLVERAKGILQRKYQISEADAYLRLRNESRRMRRPMRELAEAIILADGLEAPVP